MRDQFFVLLLERERAVEALAVLVPGAEGRANLLEQAFVSSGKFGGVSSVFPIIN